jgi:hypothetical protein
LRGGEDGRHQRVQGQRGDDSHPQVLKDQHLWIVSVIVVAVLSGKGGRKAAAKR